VATARRGTDSVKRQFVVKRTPRPDLTAHFNGNCRNTVLIIVRNVGDADAPDSTLLVEFSDSTGVVGSMSFPILPLPHGSSTSVQFAPSSQPLGYKAYVDADDAIKESNETNNTDVC
jgi:hypothetical protein